MMDSKDWPRDVTRRYTVSDAYNAGWATVFRKEWPSDHMIPPRSAFRGVWLEAFDEGRRDALDARCEADSMLYTED